MWRIFYNPENNIDELFSVGYYFNGRLGIGKVKNHIQDFNLIDIKCKKFYLGNKYVLVIDDLNDLYKWGDNTWSPKKFFNIDLKKIINSNFHYVIY